MAGQRWREYGNYLRRKYGNAVRRLPVDLRLACPSLQDERGESVDSSGRGGENPGDERRVISVREQLLSGRRGCESSTGAGSAGGAGDFGDMRYTALFTSPEATCLPAGHLKTFIREAMSVEGVVRIALASRPDCLSYDYLREIQGMVRTVDSSMDLALELELITVNYRALDLTGCGYGLAEFIDAVLTARTCGLDVGAVLRLDLSADEEIDVRENARVLSALRVDYLNLQANTSPEEEIFRRRLEVFLAYLDPGLPLDLPGGEEEKGRLREHLAAEGIRQGQKFSYLQGEGLQKFPQSGCDAI